MADILLSTKSKSEEPSPWSNLPSLVLEKIYSFLSRIDRVNMSLVSPNWSHEFESPSLWKSFRFTMTGSMLGKGDACSLMDCVRKYSRYFKHVRIFFERDMKREEFLIWSEHFQTFLKILTNTSQIVSIKFVYLGKCFRALRILEEHSTCESICTELDHFFGSQRNLKRLEFYGSFFKDKDGVQLLKKSFDNCNDSLKTLVLHDFFASFEEGLAPEQIDPCIEQLLPSILSLKNLSHLEVDYRLIFAVEQPILSIVLEKLKNLRKETYLKIITDIEHLVDFDDFKFLTPNDWSYLKRHYPNLDMDLTVNTFAALALPLESMILEHMPISVLSYNTDYPNFKDLLEAEIDEFLRHVIACKISNDLVSLTLEWSKPLSDLASVFIPFLKVCQKLKRLDLNIVYPANHLNVLLESLLNNRPPSLEEFELTILDVEKEQVQPLRNLGSKFENRLKAVKLNFKLLVEEIEPEDPEDQK